MIHNAPVEANGSLSQLVYAYKEGYELLQQQWIALHAELIALHTCTQQLQASRYLVHMLDIRGISITALVTPLE